MKKFAIVIFFLLSGCVYAPTITYAPCNNYAPVYAPTRPPAYVPVYPPRPVYGPPQNIQSTGRYYPATVRRRVR